MTQVEAAKAIRDGLDLYSQVDANGQPVTAAGAKKILNVELATGSSVIGTVAISQTTPGTTNGVVVNAVTASATTNKVDVGLVNGEAVDVGAGTEAAAIRVTLPTNGTGVIATVGAVTAITNALPAGTNAIGKLAPNSGVDIGDVDVTSLPALVAGTALIGKVSIDQVTANANEVVTKTGSTTVVSALTSSATNAKVDVALVNGEAIDVGAGTEAAAIRVTLPTNGTGVIAGVTTVTTLTGTTSLTPGTGATNLGKAEDAVHTSGDVGVMSLSVANEAQVSFGADGDYVPLGTDRTGAQYIVAKAGTAVIGKVGIDQTTPGTTNLVQTKETPDATSTFAITPYVSAALEASAVVKASAGVLYGFIYVNGNAATRYVQVFNSTTVPADTTVPVLTFPVAAGATLSFDTGKFGNFFSTGIAICNSSTQFTKTIGAADSLFYVQKA